MTKHISNQSGTGTSQNPLGESSYVYIIRTAKTWMLWYCHSNSKLSHFIKIKFLRKWKFMVYWFQNITSTCHLDTECTVSEWQRAFPTWRCGCQDFPCSSAWEDQFLLLWFSPGRDVNCCPLSTIFCSQDDIWGAVPCSHILINI